MHIIFLLVIMISAFNILSLYLGDKLIVYLNLEEKYPKIAKFIQLRRKFQNYYLLLNTSLILIIFLVLIIVNLIFLF